MQTLQLINLSPDALVAMLADKITERKMSSTELGEMLALLVPYVSRQQAAYLLDASPAFVGSLIDRGHLQEHDTKDNARIKTLQVWECRLKGLTGNKKNINLEKIL